MHEYFLSIIIPVFNTPSDLFNRCLDSISCSNSRDIQVIVIDDGSKEEQSKNTISIIDNHSLINIEYHKKNNGGQNSARQLGLTYAKGDYVFFMDSDDYVETSEFNHLIKLLKEKRPKILAFNYDVRTTENEIIESHVRWKDEYQIVDIKEGLLYSDSLCLQVYHRMELLQSGVKLVQGVNIGEDFASSTAILANIQSLEATNICFYHYIKRKGSTLNNPPTESKYDIITAYDFMLDIISEDSLLNYYSEFEWLAILHVLYYGSIRILTFFDCDEKGLSFIQNWMRNRFPNWESNKYLQVENLSHNWKYNLISKKRYTTLKCIYRTKAFIKKLIYGIKTS